MNNEKFTRPKVITPLKCGEYPDMDVGRDRDTSCVSLEHRRRAPCAKPLSPRVRKPRCPARGPEPPEELPPCRSDARASGKRKRLPPGGRKSPNRSECATGVDVRIPCWENCDENEDMDAVEKTWLEESGCSSMNVGDSRSHRSDQRRKRCASDKGRNVLRAKLRELLSETEPIPESCLLDNAESKPEPEILAEVLLMSEAEGIDLARVKPDSVFDNLFASLASGRSIPIASAAPQSTMSNVVVPIQVPGEATSTSFGMANIADVMEKTRNQIPPNPNAFQQSAGYEDFSSHMTELLDRKPGTESVSEFLGSSVIIDETDGTQRIQDSILDYVIKPGPTTHANRIRLNGSAKPSWFPGYILVTPAIPGCVRMTEDPGEALNEAWSLCRPRNFQEESRHLVDIR